MRWTVGLMVLFFFLLASGCARSVSDSRPAAQPADLSESAQLAAAVDRYRLPKKPYRFVLKVAVEGDTPASAAGKRSEGRYFVGTVTGRDWTITGRMRNQTYHLVSRGGILTLRMAGRDIVVPPSLHGLFSPRDHLSVVRRYLDRATPTRDVPAAGRAVPAVRVDVPTEDVAAMLLRALGPAFQGRDALAQAKDRARVTYVLGVDPQSARVASLHVIVLFADPSNPVQHVLEYRFLEG